MRALLLSLVLVGACASAGRTADEPAPAPAVVAFDPVGVYDFSTTVEGQAVSGVVTIRRGDQGLTGVMTTPLTGELPLSRIAVDGRRVTFSTATGEGAISMQMTVGEDDRITGSWSANGGAMTGTVTGRRRS